MPDVEGDAGAVRAGAAFAARRREIGLSQRELARRKVITAANLGKFEKGRAWPRDKTRAKLEQAVGWPPGELTRLHAGIASRDGSAIEPPSHPDSSSSNDGSAIESDRPPADSAGVVSEAVRYAVSQVVAAADNLPSPTEQGFSERIGRVLADVRALETIVTRAVRSTRGDSDVLRALTTVRELYGELMALAASSPAATLGQRLYAARNKAALSVADVAAAVDVTPEAVESAETELFISEEQRRRLEVFLAGLADQ